MSAHSLNRRPRRVSVRFTELGEAVRGRPPGPGLGGAQLKRELNDITRGLTHVFLCYDTLYSPTITLRTRVKSIAMPLLCQPPIVPPMTSP